MATALVKTKRIAILHELNLNHTENQIREFYLSGDFSELCGEERRVISGRTFERDMLTVVKELAKSRQTELTSEEYNAKVEKWKRRLESEIEKAHSQNQIGVISTYLMRLMALDGISIDGLRTGTGDTYIFKNSVIVLQQPEKVEAVETELAEWREIEEGEK